jgi:hypothetical protein
MLGLGVGGLIAALVLFVGVGSGTFAYLTPEGEAVLPNGFSTAIAAIAALAVLVERAVEVLLHASGNQPEPITDPLTGARVKPDLRPVAAQIGIVLGVVISVSGIRILETLVEVTPCTATLTENCVNSSAQFLFGFSDILLTAGLLAGGANALHPFIEAIAGLGSRLKNIASGLPAREQIAPEIVVDSKRYRVLKSTPALPAAM